MSRFRSIRKNPALAIVLTLTFLVLVCCKESDENKIRSEIDSLAARYAPDSRTEICSVTFRFGEGRKLILKGETTVRSIKNELSTNIGKSGYAVIDSIQILPDSTKSSLNWGLITLSVANCRKKPEHSSELVSQAVMGTPLRILKTEGGWHLVRTPDSYLSWIESASVILLTTDEINKWKKSDRIIYTGSTGWISSLPGAGDVVSDVVAGSLMQIEKDKSGSPIVLLPDGRRGYIAAGTFADFNLWRTNQLLTSSGILKRAHDYMGIPYLWGGASPKGADCSGFVQSVFMLNGIILQRDASMQALHGEPVSLSEEDLQPGDLLFFGPVKNGKPKVTHVAIYQGNGEYIHSSGKVQVNSLDSGTVNFSGYRKRLLLSARRITANKGYEGITTLKEHPWY